MSQINRLVIARGVVFGETTYSPKGSCGPRTQSNYQLVCMLGGLARVLVDGRELMIPQNHVALMKPGRREHFLFDPDHITHHTWCEVAPDLIPEKERHQLEKTAGAIPLSQRIVNLISAGLDFQMDGGYDQAILQIGLACLATYQFEATAGEAARYPEHLTRAISEIGKDLAHPWSVSEIANLASVSPQHLIRLFKRYLGQTPSRYLWDLRVQRGMALLRETGLPVAEIADRVGFSTPFHFARLVKERFGSSPRAIRAHAWAASDHELSVDGNSYGNHV